MLIDDHRLFADGLSMVLSQSGDYQVSTFYNARSVLEDNDLLENHDLALIDLDMPGLDGFGFLKGIAERDVKIKVVVVSGSEDRSDITRILQLGAQGFMPKNSPSEILLKGVETVLLGKLYVPENLINEVNWSELNPDYKQNLMQKYAFDNSAISARQLEVLSLLRDGHANKDIAQILDVTESTVKSHISILFKALGVKNRTACVQKGLEQGLV